MFERLCFGHERLRLSQMQLMLQFHQLMMPLQLNQQLMILSQLKYPLQMPLQLKCQAQSRWLIVLELAEHVAALEINYLTLPRIIIFSSYRPAAEQEEHLETREAIPNIQDRTVFFVPKKPMVQRYSDEA